MAVEWDDGRWSVLNMMELASQQPGYWSLARYIERDGTQHNYLYFNCPCGCNYGDCVPISEGQKKEHHWAWNGSVERPTLSPSLRRNTPCRWHGHLTDGVWSSAGDGAPLSPNLYRAGMMPPPETKTTREGDAMAESTDTPAAAAEQPETGDPAASSGPEGQTPAPSASASPEAPPPGADCRGGPREAHTWAATPVGEDPYRHTCIRCGDTLTPGPPAE